MARGEDTSDHPGRRVGRSDLENTLRSILVAPFEPHASFTGHPENEGPLNMADGLPEEDQYGAVHVNKNENIPSNEALREAAMAHYEELGIDPRTRDVRL